MKIKQNLPTIFTAIFIAFFGFFVYANDSFNKSVFNDSDQDGLSDAEELAYGTDSNNSDTDGDGYSDGAEIKSGYDPLKASPGDKIIPENNYAASDDNSFGQSEFSKNFNNKLSTFIQEHDGGDISLDNIDEFVTENIGSDIESSQSNYELTDEDISKIIVKQQKYDGLSEAERDEKIRSDEKDYLASVMYIMITNIPAEIETLRDLPAFYKDFNSKFDALMSNTPDYAYFREMGDSLEVANEQLKPVEVPESILEMHIRLLKIVKGFIALRDPSLPSIEDPLGQIIIYPRVLVLGNMSSELLLDLFKRISKQP